MIRRSRSCSSARASSTTTTQVYDPAVRQWGLLLEKYPNSKFSVGAGELILDSFNKSKDYENIETWARRLEEGAGVPGGRAAGPPGQADCPGRVQAGRGARREGRAQEGRAGVSARGQGVPEGAACGPGGGQRRGRGEARSHDLATLESAAGLLLVADHKNDPEAAEGIWIAATTYQSVGLFSKAADYDETIVDNWPKYEHHKDAAYNAVLLAHDRRRARQGYRQWQEVQARYYPRERGRRRGHLSHGQGPREGREVEGRRGSVQPLLADGAQERPAAASRRWCGLPPCASSSRTSAAPGAALGRAMDDLQAAQGPPQRRRQVLRRQGPLHAGRAHPGRVSRRSRSRATSSSSRRASSRRATLLEARGRHLPRHGRRWAWRSGRPRRSTRSASPTSRSRRRCETRRRPRA